jgi:hypothetical protein
MQVLFSKGKIWNRHKKQQDMRLFPAIVRTMGRSVKGIPSRPPLLVCSGEQLANSGKFAVKKAAARGRQGRDPINLVGGFIKMV